MSTHNEFMADFFRSLQSQLDEQAGKACYSCRAYATSLLPGTTLHTTAAALFAKPRTSSSPTVKRTQASKDSVIRIEGDGLSEAEVWERIIIAMKNG